MKGEPGEVGGSAGWTPCSQETGCHATIELRSTKRSLGHEDFYLKMNKVKWSKSIQKVFIRHWGFRENQRLLPRSLNPCGIWITAGSSGKMEGNPQVPVDSPHCGCRRRHLVPDNRGRLWNRALSYKLQKHICQVADWFFTPKLCPWQCQGLDGDRRTTTPSCSDFPFVLPYVHLCLFYFNSLKNLFF